MLIFSKLLSPHYPLRAMYMPDLQFKSSAVSIAATLEKSCNSISRRNLSRLHSFLQVTGTNKSKGLTIKACACQREWTTLSQEQRLSTEPNINRPSAAQWLVRCCFQGKYSTGTRTAREIARALLLDGIGGGYTCTFSPKWTEKEIKGKVFDVNILHREKFDVARTRAYSDTKELTLWSKKTTKAYWVSNTHGSIFIS